MNVDFFFIKCTNKINNNQIKTNKDYQIEMIKKFIDGNAEGTTKWCLHNVSRFKFLPHM